MSFDDNNLYGIAYGVNCRGRHATFKSAINAALSDLTTERNAFFDTVAERWDELFPKLPARPGRYEAGYIFLYVRSAPLSYAVRPKLRTIARRLAELPGAPARLNLRVEIHAR